jgi:hypothetical protein
MGKAEMFKPYVEKLLKEILETDSLILDDDGDVPIRIGTAMYYVRVLDTDPVMIRVFSPFLRNVKKSAKLLEKLNEINCEISYARVMWYDDDVIAANDFLAESVDKDSLDHACRHMGWLADTYDNQLKDEFGGETFFADDGSTPPDQAEVEA